MSKISRTLLVTLLLLAFLPAIHAFESTLLIEGGVGIPLDDIEGTNEMKGAWALTWDAWMIKDWLGVGFSPWFANVEVQGDDPNDSYFSSLEGINLYLKLRPTKAGALNFPEKAFIRRISPFVALGGGWSTHGSRDENGVVSNPSIPAGFRGHFTLPHAAAGISFLSKWNTTLDLGVKYDHFTKDNIDLTENAGNHLENDALLTPYVGLGIHFGTPIAVPELLYDGKLTGFSTLVGTPSAAQSYKLQGKNLKGDIDLVAPDGFVLSIDGGQVWAKSVRVPADFDGDVWVRLTGDKVGTYDGSIGHQAKGTGGLFWPVNGVVREPLLPTLALVSSGLGTFSTELGTPSAAQSYKIRGSELTGDIVIEAPAGFEFSLDGGNTYASSMRVPAGFDKDILVRMTGSQPGNFSGNISHTSPGVPALNIPVVGIVTAPKVPSIGLETGDLSAFTTELGTPSAPQSYKIKGNNLTGDIMIDAPQGYEISLDGGKTWKPSVTVPGGFNDNIWVRLTGADAGNFDGNVSHASPGAGTFNLPVAGTVIEPAPEMPEIVLTSGSLNAFSTDLGTPSEPQSYKIVGKNLTGDIVIDAPAGYEFSLDGGQNWSTSMRVPAGFDKDIWVRLTGAKAGNFSGNVAHASPGAETFNLPVSGTVKEAPKPEEPEEPEQPEEPEEPEEPKDSDGDGIPDDRDKAPFAPEDRDGFMDADGIPDPDNDADGIPDALDGAPMDPEDKDGFEDTDGIPDPDNDADGIPDVSDLAPGTDQTVAQGINTKETYNDFEDTDGVPDELPGNPLLDQLEEDLLKHMVHFDTNLYTIRASDKPFLDRVAEALKQLPEVMIEIQGHTDSTGNDKINEPLSYNRAKVVKDYLVARGVDAEQIESKGYGSKVPVATNDTVAGRQENRRAQMVLIK